MEQNLMSKETKDDFPSDEELVNKLRFLMRQSNLTEITPKILRIELETCFNCNLSQKKQFVKDAWFLKLFFFFHFFFLYF